LKLPERSGFFCFLNGLLKHFIHLWMMKLMKFYLQACMIWTSPCTLQPDSPECPGCITGERGCPADYDCGNPGSCEDAAPER